MTKSRKDTVDITTIVNDCNVKIMHCNHYNRQLLIILEKLLRIFLLYIKRTTQASTLVNNDGNCAILERMVESNMNDYSNDITDVLEKILESLNNSNYKLSYTIDMLDQMSR